MAIIIPDLIIYNLESHQHIVTTDYNKQKNLSMKQKPPHPEDKRGHELRQTALISILAEAVRFELTEGFPSAVFKTAGLNHSPKPPRARIIQKSPANSKYLLYL